MAAASLVEQLSQDERIEKMCAAAILAALLAHDRMTEDAFIAGCEGAWETAASLRRRQKSAQDPAADGMRYGLCLLPYVHGHLNCGSQCAHDCELCANDVVPVGREFGRPTPFRIK